jgi:uncharacterized protein (TIGR03000 family)
MLKNWFSTMGLAVVAAAALMLLPEDVSAGRGGGGGGRGGFGGGRGGWGGGWGGRAFYGGRGYYGRGFYGRGYYGYYSSPGWYYDDSDGYYYWSENGVRKSRLTIKVPSEDAEVEVSGKELKKHGTTRPFTARMGPGQRRAFRITARWEDDSGREVKDTKKVSLGAGQRKKVRFEEPASQQQSQ